jgi:hypothetical protein
MLQQTCEEIRNAEYFAEARRANPTLRQMLRESDVLMQWLEESRLRNTKMVPYWVWQRLITLIGKVDPRRSHQLRTERNVERLSDELFEVQQLMMARNVRARAEGGTNIVPLFR